MNERNAYPAEIYAFARTEVPAAAEAVRAGHCREGAGFNGARGKGDGGG